MQRAEVRSLIIAHSPSKQSQSYDGILSHHDVILCHILPIEVSAFARTLRKQVAHESFAHHTFRPNELNHKHFFA